MFFIVDGKDIFDMFSTLYNEKMTSISNQTYHKKWYYYDAGRKIYIVARYLPKFKVVELYTSLNDNF